MGTSVKKINHGVLKSDRTEKGDETYTPFYAVEPIIKYLPKEKIIWCPFDEGWSAYCQQLKAHGFRVIHSSLTDGKDFFRYEPKEWDVIVSNPPFSKKDQVLGRLYSLGKPFAVLLPLASLQGVGRYPYFKKGIQILAFDKRICFYRNGNYFACAPGCAFASVYFCRFLLPNDLILEELVRDERPLQNRQETERKEAG
jgi:hypothetical protein